MHPVYPARSSQPLIDRESWCKERYAAVKWDSPMLDYTYWPICLGIPTKLEEVACVYVSGEEEMLFCQVTLSVDSFIKWHCTELVSAPAGPWNSEPRKLEPCLWFLKSIMLCISFKFSLGDESTKGSSTLGSIKFLAQKIISKKDNFLPMTFLD